MVRKRATPERAVTSVGRQYQVQQLLGRGGFGSVYKATMVGAGNFSKPVAIKMLNADVEEVNEISERFRDEARVLGLVRHRAIVNVDGLVRLTPRAGGKERWGVVMEYIEGVNLRTVRENGPMPPGPASEIIEEIAHALHTAWSRPGPQGQPLRLIHRDIKPGNIQLTPAGEVKLLDFGIARADFLHREAKTRSLMFGSMTYMSPERIERSLTSVGADGPEGDIYSLGAVLYEIVTGNPFTNAPLQQADHQQAIFQRMDEVWLAIDESNEDLVRLFGDMMRHDPQRRPTARAVAQRAAEIGRRIAEERLRDWAERVIPPLAERAEQRDFDEFSGAVLMERSDGLVVTPPPKPAPIPAPTPPPRRSYRGLLMGGAAVAVVGALLALVIAVPFLLNSDKALSPEIAPAQEISSSPAPITKPTPKPATATAPTPATATAPAIATTPAPGEEEPLRVGSAPDVLVNKDPKTVHQPDPVPEPEPIPPQPAKVVLRGDVDSAKLTNGVDNYPMGEVPAGTYKIVVQYDSIGYRAGSVTVRPGETKVLTCSADFATCD